MFDFQTATLSALSTSLCWNVKVLASLTSCIWNKSCSQSQRSSVSSCSLPPRDTYRPWHRFCKSTHTHALQLLLISSHHLTPLVHLGLPDMAFSVTLDQVGSLHSLSNHRSVFPLQLSIKLYGKCQCFFDSVPWCFEWIISACAGESSHSLFNRVSI